MTLRLPPLPEKDVWAIGSLDMREDVYAYSDEAMRGHERAVLEAVLELVDRCVTTDMIEELVEELRAAVTQPRYS